MCGIFAYSGKRNNAGKLILEGLKSLEYRGYDSWGIVLKKTIGELSESEVKKIEDILKTPENYNMPDFLFNRKLDPETMKDGHIVGNDLRLMNDFDIRRLKRIRSYKGIRHNLGLKVRGQRIKRFRKGGAAVAKKKVKLK